MDVSACAFAPLRLVSSFCQLGRHHQRPHCAELFQVFLMLFGVLYLAKMVQVAFLKLCSFVIVVHPAAPGRVPEQVWRIGPHRDDGTITNASGRGLVAGRVGGRLHEFL